VVPADPARPAEEGPFTISLQLGGPRAARLRALPNSDQAYCIFPQPGYAGLSIVALTPRGLYYGARTLAQLISYSADDGSVQMPIIRVTDWPDLSERGLWGSDSFLHLPWLGRHKMNVVEQIAAIWVDGEGRGQGRMKTGREAMLTLGPAHGILPVPAVLHLNQLSSKGLFEAYPELVPRGGDKGAVCLSQPAFSKVLADWIVALGSMPWVKDVDVWLTENLHGRGGCRCEQCKQTDRNVLETRAVLRGWRLARERLPGVGLRILLSEETYRSNNLVLAELPPEVKVVYYHSLLTYTAGRCSIVPRLMQAAAQGGRWIGITPQLTGTVGPAAPFTGAEFIRFRMREITGKGLSSVTGYATPRLAHCRFNVEATAEWSWNPGGRTPHEFAFSYAVRHGLPKPEKFARWSELIGPVQWRMYGSDWPVGERRRALRPVVKALQDGKLPGLGKLQLGTYRFPWAEYKTEQQVLDDVTTADRSVALSREMAQPQLVQESLYTQGCARALLALVRLKRLLHNQPPGQSSGAQASQEMERFSAGCRQAAGAVRAWALMIDPELDPEPESRYWQVEQVLIQLADDMERLKATRVPAGEE